jgi:hypothetical protein
MVMAALYTADVLCAAAYCDGTGIVPPVFFLQKQEESRLRCGGPFITSDPNGENKINLLHVTPAKAGVQGLPLA